MPTSPTLPQLHFDRDAISSLPQLLERYSEDEFASPTRSTVPLVSLINWDWPVMARLLQECGFGSDAAVHFEWKVDSPRVGIRASQTDLMILTSRESVAIEA